MDDASGPADPSFLLPGTVGFRAVSRALFAVGLATFAVLYCVQPLEPVLSTQFGVSAAESSLALSLTTGMLAPMLLVASSVSDAVGRKPVIVSCILASTILTLAAAVAPGWGSLLVLRLLTGVTLSGLQAVAMAYVGEEVAPGAIGFAMGLFVSGSSLGGLAGRLLAGLVTGAASWRTALAATAVLALLSGLDVWRVLPASQHFAPRALRLRASLTGLQTHLAQPELRCLYAIALLVMGGFVATYSLIGYRLLGPPYGLSPAIVSAIFLIYLMGTVSSTWMGSLADRWGRGQAMLLCLGLALAGIGLTLASPLSVVVGGLAVFTFGFFGVHAIASGWVSRVARSGRAQASALYLFSFYVGSSVIASLIALVWPGFGWPGVAACVIALLLAAVAVAGRLLVTSNQPPV